MNGGPPLGPAALNFLERYFEVFQAIGFASLTCGLALLIVAWIRHRAQPARMKSQ